MLEKIISILVSIIIPGIIIGWVKIKLDWKGSRLSYYVSNIADFIVKSSDPEKQDTKIYTHSINIKNNGNVSAEQVDVSHRLLPLDYHITPCLEHEILNNRVVRFKNISPGEIVTISYLYFSSLTPHQIHEYVRSKDGYARHVGMILNPIYPRWFNILILGFMILGLIFLGMFIWWIMPVIIHGIKYVVNFPR